MDIGHEIDEREHLPTAVPHGPLRGGRSDSMRIFKDGIEMELSVRGDNYDRTGGRRSGLSWRARRDVRFSVVGSTELLSLNSDATPRIHPTSSAGVLAITAHRMCIQNAQP
ncbi:hypothetical protein GCM10008985_06670 [Halococcus dombrowskii]|uniref:Uncharacterized protein n=1 Tax=Halococcus dombrowskii TaxID=179637 RepID=A0AAV3SE86_HALDO